MDGRLDDVLVGTLSSVEIEGLGTRRMVGEKFHAEPMLVRDGFVSAASIALPAAWALPDASPAVVATLGYHGLDVRRLTAAAEVEVQAFVTTELRRADRLFQGHHEVRLTGEWESTRRQLPIGTLVIRADQRWGRVAAQLLEPQSEDSLATWNFFEEGTKGTGDGGPGRYPVLRLESIDALVMDED